MSRSACPRAVRFVITKDDRIGSDNTNWTLAYLLKYGMNITIMDIPMYILDFRKDIQSIFDKNGAIFDSLFDIKSAICISPKDSGLFRQRLVFILFYKIIELNNDICDFFKKEGDCSVQG